MDISTQKQFGSYYTEADITEYISTTTIIPFLFEAVQRKCPAAFAPEGPVWSLLREDPDRYICRALKHGCALALPPEIAAGVQNISLRQEWNRPAPAAYALPLESWRELVERRQRYRETRARISEGEIYCVEDLITCNLDMRGFAREVIARCPEAELLNAFSICLERLSILDPTCGAGAFLLAALRVLEPLYEACLERMQCLLERQDCQGATAPPNHALLAHMPERFRTFLQEAGECSARRYALCKFILMHNLYGVDILPEAIERCQQCLLLALATYRPIGDVEYAEIEQALACHLRVGNALIGFATSPSLLIQAEASRAQLDEILAAEYGVDRLRLGDAYAEKLAAWRESFRPFHWPAEFREITQKSGFDVILGNPPYVACKNVNVPYELKNYQTQACGNLYACTLERALELLRPGGRCGMVVPVSAISGERFRPLNRLLAQRRIWVSSYSNRPARLFAGVEQRLAILLIGNTQPPALFSSPYQHWYRSERAHLFETLTYIPASTWPQTGMPLKSGSRLAEAIFARLLRRPGLPLLKRRRTEAAVWIHNGPTYWVRALPFEPNTGGKSTRSNHYRKIPVSNQRDAFLLAAVLSSSTFYLFYKLVSNCRDLGRKELRHFPLGQMRPELAERLVNLGYSLARRLQATAAHCSRRYASGVILYEEYYPSRAKDLLDQIDRVLAEHYGLSEEELDFILNYAIKYRMGREFSPES